MQFCGFSITLSAVEVLLIFFMGCVISEHGNIKILYLSVVIISSPGAGRQTKSDGKSSREKLCVQDVSRGEC